MKLPPINRYDWLRFGVFLLIVTGMTLYVSARWPDFRQSRQRTAVLPASGAAVVARDLAPAGPTGADRLPALPPAMVAPPAPGTASEAAAATADFFAEYRLERDRAHGQEREMLREIMTGATATDEARRQANLRYLALSNSMGLEAQLEGLIRGRGFADAVVFLGEGTAQVIVKAPTLTSQEAAQMGDLVRQVAGVKPTAISIVRRER